MNCVVDTLPSAGKSRPRFLLQSTPRSKIEQYSMRLNPGQQQAVEFVTGPCLVLAGAVRKTRVITNKIAHLIRGCGYQARHIAAVTFTNKAAREMKERVGQTLGRKEARGLMISPSPGLDIIKREYAALGMKSNFSLFDDTDRRAAQRAHRRLIEDDKVVLQQLISTISQLEKRSENAGAGGGWRAKGERTASSPTAMGSMMRI